MIRMYIERRSDNGIQTVGDGFTVDENSKIKTLFHSLELPWKDNIHEISCIPKGKYWVKKHNSPKFGKCFEIQNVPDRLNILIHFGNFNYNSTGCVLVGDGLADINNDGQLDVLKSRDTLKKLYNELPNEFELLIT